MRMIKPVVLSTGFVIAGTLAGLAHTKMTASVPKNGANVASPLSAIEMTFAKPLRLTMVKVVRTEDQQHVPVVGGLPETFATSVKAAVVPLPVGPTRFRGRRLPRTVT